MNEYKAVIEPLERWFKNQRANWKTRKCEYPTAETGWDLEARRKNCDLLIEAKYIQKAFISGFSGLVCAPLVKRRQYYMKRKDKSWCNWVCWAIGSSYETRNIYQLLLDYIARNLTFWSHYGNDLKMKYIFFVDKNQSVSFISWKKMCENAKKFAPYADDNLENRRKLANELMLRGLRNTISNQVKKAR